MSEIISRQRADEEVFWAFGIGILIGSAFGTFLGFVLTHLIF